MTATATTRPATAGGPAPRRHRRSSLAQWAADLVLGVRLSVSGGRAGWARLLLIAVGVGLGVATLLVATTAPAVVAARDARAGDREAQTWVDESDVLPPGEGTALTTVVRSAFRDRAVEGRLLQADGDAPPTPPGVERFPGPGEAVVSPALAELLASDDGAALRGRWGEVVGTIGPEGLTGPEELTFYLGTDELTDDTAPRIERFGGLVPADDAPQGALLLLAVVAAVVLLLPVGIFITTAVRFGGEARDRRLAALRLVGADARSVRRIAAGETLSGAALGLVVGGLLFAGVLTILPGLVPAGLSYYPGDQRPVPALVALVVVLVPVAAVVVTMSAMQRVVVEPLGVVRRSGDRRRRLWWRLVLPVAGLAMLTPLLTDGMGASAGSQTMVSAGLVLLLVGVALLLPWLVEAVVRRLGGGGVAWQLAIRRLQLDSGTSVRAVSGIAVSVAGLIALHGLVDALENVSATSARSADSFQAALYLHGAQDDPRWMRLTDTPGVQDVVPIATSWTTDPGTGQEVAISVGTCAVLVVEAKVGDCTDGDVFTTVPSHGTTPEAGTTYRLGAGPSAPTWTVPAGLRTVDPADGSMDSGPPRVLVTPAALEGAELRDTSVSLHVVLDPAVPDALEHLRTAAARIDPTAHVDDIASGRTADLIGNARQALLMGTVALLVLIGASILVNVVEQLRERRRLLAVLVAFGARRRTLGASVLLQLAVPVALGMALAVVTGTALAAVLQRGVDAPPTVDWVGIGTTSGVAALVVLLTTSASLPLLWGLMRPAGLRTE